MFKKSGQSSRWKQWKKTPKYIVISYICNQVEKISSIPKISLIDGKNESRNQELKNGSDFGPCDVQTYNLGVISTTV